MDTNNFYGATKILSQVGNIYLIIGLYNNVRFVMNVLIDKRVTILLCWTRINYLLNINCQPILLH